MHARKREVDAMQTAASGNGRQATLYRMVLPDHVCPFGLRSLEMLQRSGYAVDDRTLTSREQTDAFKAEHGIRTTPLVFIDGERIGGSDDLERWLAR
jgi:glutaredoxin